ncbi:MAG: SDR family oxidoreductase [Chloroflexi bacterium]|nr:SDR family oxidoreductase [Chloroflexota bacterium]
MKTAIIVSASSDIGYAICQRWLGQGMRVYATYRTDSQQVSDLKSRGIPLVHCDLAKRHSILSACSVLRELCPQWDVLIMCPGIQDPIGPFLETEFGLWEESVMVNFVGQICFVRELLSTRQASSAIEPIVLLFAGGGPNKATVNYSAYAVSKVALIKMTELLDAEISDSRFVIINPGWVKTKAHESMLKAGTKTGEDYWRTVKKFESDEWTPMERVVDCCDWLIQMPRKLISGRYFGVEFDAWGSETLNQRLARDPNLCKLRRCE